MKVASHRHCKCFLCQKAVIKDEMKSLVDSNIQTSPHKQQMGTLERVLINYFIKFNLEKQSELIQWAASEVRKELKNAVWSLTASTAHHEQTHVFSHVDPLHHCRRSVGGFHSQATVRSKPHQLFMLLFIWSPIPTWGCLHALKSHTFTLLTGWKKGTRHKKIWRVCAILQLFQADFAD